MLVTWVFTHCIYTNTVSTNTVPDTPSGATPTVQDVTASHDEHRKQGMSVHNSCCSLTFINMHKRVLVPNYQSATRKEVSENQYAYATAMTFNAQIRTQQLTDTANMCSCQATNLFLTPGFCQIIISSDVN